MDNLQLIIKKLLSSGSCVWNDFSFNHLYSSKDSKINWLFSNLKELFLSEFDEDISEVKTIIYRSSSSSSSDYIDSFLDLDNLIPLENAWTLLSKLLLHKNNSEVKKLFPISILCDGNTNKKKTYVLNVFLKSPSKDIKNDSDILVQTVSVLGQFSQDKFTTKNLKSFAALLMFDPHLLNSSSKTYKDTSISSFGKYVYYEMLTNYEEAIFSDSYISFEVSRNQSEFPFELTGSSDSSIVINIKAVPGDEKSFAFPAFQELKLIEGLLEGFSTSRQLTWANKETNRKSSDFKSIIQMVKEFLEKFDSQFSDSDTSYDREEVKTCVPERTELDFTESLWNIMKCVGSLQELVECFKAVMAKLKQGGNYNFWKHSDNKTLIANLVESFNKGEVALPQIDKLLPLRALIEIGIDKMYRDYHNFFGHHKLVGYNQLQKHFTEIVDKDPISKIQKQFKVLLKFHHVFELSVNCLCHINAPISDLFNCVG